MDNQIKISDFVGKLVKEDKISGSFPDVLKEKYVLVDLGKVNYNGKKLYTIKPLSKI